MPNNGSKAAETEEKTEPAAKPTITIAEKESGKADAKPTITIAEKEGSGE